MMINNDDEDEKNKEKEGENEGDQVIFRIEDQSNLVWRFPLHVSQSSLAGKTQLSNACTLIALKIAELLHNHHVFMPTSLYRQIGGLDRAASPPPCDDHATLSQLACPPAIFASLVNGIIDGNEAYASDAGATSTRVYNLPDAIKACDATFAEVDFRLCHAKIAAALPRMIQAAVKCPAFGDDQRLVFVIIGCIRTVLLIYERVTDSLTLFDTHMHVLYDVDRNEHFRHGALIASSKMSNIARFALWIECNIFPDISTCSNGEFEISMIRFAGTAKTLCAATHTVASNRSMAEKEQQKIVIFDDDNDENNNGEKKKKVKSKTKSTNNKKNDGVVDKYPILRSLLSIPPKRLWTLSDDGGVDIDAETVADRKRIKLCA